MKNLLSISQLNRKEIENYILLANKFLNNKNQYYKNKFVIALLFFEESTRTELGFESATYHLGGNVIKLHETKFQKNVASKEESIEDTIKVIQSYADLLVIRHFDGKIFEKISPFLQKPIINGGNGTDEHPTQALIDLLTIYNLKGKIDNLKIAIIGNLKHMRVAHSLVLALQKFNNIQLKLISPKVLKLPKEYLINFKNNFKETEKMNLEDSDIIYVTGFPQKTPIGNFSFYVRKHFQINKNILKQLKPNAKILCPLPRIDEITKDVDGTKFAKYFQQSDLGLYMRMAIIYKALQK
jgi:aspartate carbamoyltransferase catalytic subunit